MFIVTNKANVVIAKFRSMEQIQAWAKRLEIIMENINIRFDASYVGNEWVREDYR